MKKFRGWVLFYILAVVSAFFIFFGSYAIVALLKCSDLIR